MPWASWRGFLAPIYGVLPDLIVTGDDAHESVRLHQARRLPPVYEEEDQLQDGGRGQQASTPSRPRLIADDASLEADQSLAATRITHRPHDPGTGEEIDGAEVVKDTNTGRGQFVTFTAEELKALDGESSKVIDLEKFVPGAEIDPVYFDSLVLRLSR
jgi:hypothetical protein